MKQLYTTVIYFFFFVVAQGQSGNVGIGTTTPTQKLDVDGKIRIRGGSPAEGLVLQATDASGNAVWGKATHNAVSGVSTNGTGWRKVAHIDGSSGRSFGKITVYTTGGSYTPRMTTIEWAHDWSTGAGLTVSSESPSSNYWSEVRVTDDGTNAYIEVNFTSNLISQLSAISSNYGYRTAVLYSGTLPTGGGTVRITSRVSELNVGGNHLNVDFNGEVGIGVSNPGARLDINSTSSIGIKVNSTYGSDHWLLQTNTNGANYSGLWETSDDIRLLLRDNAGNIDIDMRPDGSSFINGGNLGVGTTTPSQKLHVVGTTRVSTLSGTGTRGVYATASGDLTTTGPTSGVDGYWIRTGTSLKPKTTGDDILLNSPGRIEIQVGDRNIEIDDANPTWYGDGYGGVVYFYGDASISASKLQAGGLELERKLQVNSIADASGTSGTGVIEIGTGTDQVRLDGNEIITNTNRTFYINNDNNGDVQMDAGTFFVDASVSRVGIGTTAPSQKLHVVGSSLVTDKTYIGSTDAYFYRDVSNRIATPADFYVQSTSSNTYLYSAKTYLGGSSGDLIHLRANKLDWDQGVIQGNGSVGIGTTAPAYKLEVKGGSSAVTSIKTDGYAYDVSGVIQGNYVPSHSWKIGTGSVGVFAQNGSTSENSRVWGIGPHGNRVILWKATPDATSGADGGWNSSSFKIDHTKAYRVSVWIKKTGNTNGTTYIGCLGGHTNKLDGTANSNPYFWSSDLPVIGRWYLLVGYIHGSGDATTTSYGGIYDGTTGKKVINITDFKFPTSATLQRHRSYLYYNTTTSNRQYWWDPRFEEVNGKEPSIQALVGIAPNSVSLGQGASTYKSTSEMNLASNNTGIFSYSSGVGWTPGTWQTVSSFAVTRNITSGSTVNITVTARVEGDNYNYYVPSTSFFRLMRGSTELARTSAYMSPANYVSSGFWYFNSNNFSFNVIDTGLSGNQTYTVQYWLPNEFSSGTEYVRIGERIMNVIELRP